MSDQSSAAQFGWVGYAISLVSLVGVVYWATRQDPPEIPSSPAELVALGGAVVLYGVATLVRGERWWRMLRQSDVDAERADAYGLVAVGYMGNAALPARWGDAIRTYLMSRAASTSIRDVLGTLIAERILDAAFLVTLFAVIAFGVLRGIEIPGEERLLLVAAGVALALAVGLAVVRLAKRYGYGQRVVEFLAPVGRATRELRGRYGLRMIALTATLWSIEGLEVLAIGSSTGLELTVAEALYLLAVTGVFLLIPSGPGHLGPLDAGVVFGVHAIGGTGSQAVSFLLAVRFVLFVPVTLAGLVVLITRYGGLDTIRAARARTVQP